MKKELTVSELNRYIKNLINNDFILSDITVKGEISGLKISRGNAYFNLKDDNASVSCISFYDSNIDFNSLKDGNTVLIKGKIGLYEKSGQYSLYVKEVENIGLGKFYIELEKLKQKLQDNGMLSEENKKEIPPFSINIGVVTSKDGAAIKDIEKTILNKNPFAKIYLYPAKVQGIDAALSIERGIDLLDKLGLDVIIVGRGGGSTEDLNCFNDERVAYSIYSAKTPIISAVGHEIDYTIADLVADKRVATPTAAGEAATFDYYEFENNIYNLKEELTSSINIAVDRLSEDIENKRRYIDYLSPVSKLNRYKESNIDKRNQLNLIIQRKTDLLKSNIDNLKYKLRLYYQLDKLENGMAFVTDKYGKKVIYAKDIKINNILNIEMKDYKLTVQVLRKEKRHK